MDWKKKLALPHQFPHALSSRRKLVSGFSLGVGASLIVLTVLVLSYSLKSPFMIKPFFQSSSSFRGNFSVVSWPFSFAPSPSSAAVGTANGTVVDKTHEVNLSLPAKDASILGNTQVAREADVLDFTNNREFLDSNVSGTVSEKTHSANLSKEGNNFSHSAKENVTGEKCFDGSFSNATFVNGSSMIKSAGSSENSNFGNIRVSENSSAVNLSHNGGNALLPGEEERAPEMNGRGNFTEKNNITFSSDYDSQLTEMQNGSYGACDIFNGRWVRDDSKPYYPAGSCPYIDRDFDCHLNGRPDNAFLRWKWQPNGCDIPSLNATDFLERLRGKKLVFVGDSLNRNMWESLVCILCHSIRNKKRVYEISGRREFKKKGFYAFRFEDYNCSVDFVGAPFLVRESSFKGTNGSFETLRLDLMDRTTSMYHDADVIVFNTGHWWTHEKTSRGEDYYQEGNHVHPRLKVLEAYKRALRTWARWVDKNIDSNRTQVFFRGYSVTHFRGGPWNSGGQCHKETEPISNAIFLAKYPSKMRALEHVLGEMKTPVIYLNISRLTDYRKDGHPSIYRREYKTLEEQIAAEQSQDCSHWCLPGVPDTWNELLYASLLVTRRN
ncbi:protein trichome birefringence-like 2 [Malania oleifera]|uniref:protein trichome birefringence-like 2 n=1 Tax=Malania oleifera TaxID=397392 RepID=UPI0025ADF623|nr:protein trichome birefringence-like 2 [Malania oleifera]